MMTVTATPTNPSGSFLCHKLTFWFSIKVQRDARCGRLAQHLNIPNIMNIQTIWRMVFSPQTPLHFESRDIPLSRALSHGLSAWPIKDSGLRSSLLAGLSYANIGWLALDPCRPADAPWRNTRIIISRRQNSFFSAHTPAVADVFVDITRLG